MFDFASSGPKVKQTTTNQQVGVQGQGATGVSGTARQGAIAGAGAVAIAPINLRTIGKGAIGPTVNITTTTTDREAFSTIGQISNNQAAISVAAVNASHQLAINSLAAMSDSNKTAALLAENAVGGAIEVAGMAAPVSEGNISLAAGRNRVLVIVSVVFTIAIVAYVYRRKLGL